MGFDLKPLPWSRGGGGMYHKTTGRVEHTSDLNLYALIVFNKVQKAEKSDKNQSENYIHTIP